MVLDDPIVARNVPLASNLLTVFRNQLPTNRWPLVSTATPNGRLIWAVIEATKFPPASNLATELAAGPLP